MDYPFYNLVNYLSLYIILSSKIAFFVYSWDVV